MKNKTILIVSVTVLWLLAAVCSLVTQESNVSWSYGYDAAEEGRVSVGEGTASLFYGPSPGGDTQVVLHCGGREWDALIPSGFTGCRSVFPAGSEHVGAAFSHENRLDTVVLFAAAGATVFEHVLALDSGLHRVAHLETDGADGLNLVVSAFDKTTLSRVPLPGHTARFLQHPEIGGAAFYGAQFRLDTPAGTFRAGAHSPI